MRKDLLTILASVALLAAGPFAANAHQTNQTSANAHHKRIVRHQSVVHPSSDITSFSSSSALHIGVNHPPKNR
jgi:hypothetical protein